MNRARTTKRDRPSLAGCLLLAHPGLQDPNFRRTVVLLSAHSAEGALGVVINRPLGTTLEELDDVFAGSPLADVPVFRGGPVSDDQVILAAWQLLPAEGSFRLFFGLDPDKLAVLRGEHEGLETRAFRGYAGWGQGQLEAELTQDSWIVQPVNLALLARYEGEELWRRQVATAGPRLQLEAGAPDEPERN